MTTSIRPFIDGDQITLRGLRKEDMENYRSWLDNSNATQFMESGWRPTSSEELDKLYEISTQPQDTAVFVIENKNTRKAIGICGLYLIQWVCRRAEFRILIGDDSARGQGFGTEAAKLCLTYAFNKLNLNLVYLGVNSENKAAVRSYENAGFVSEGLRRQLIYRNGRYYDALMMSVLRDEYDSIEEDKG